LDETQPSLLPSEQEARTSGSLVQPDFPTPRQASGAAILASHVRASQGAQKPRWVAPTTGTVAVVSTSTNVKNNGDSACRRRAAAVTPLILHWDADQLGLRRAADAPTLFRQGHPFLAAGQSVERGVSGARCDLP